jgi:GDP-4-dehydro-6-deoxy-D-mannose reductase
MRALVTGAGGFVGGWLVGHLAASGDDVRGVGREELDVQDAEAVRALIAGFQPDVLFHLAGITSHAEAEADPRQAVATNILATVNIVEGLAAAARQARMVVPSSSEVYRPPRPDELPLTEESPVGPNRVYGATKLGQESLALAVGRLRGVNVVVTRSFNHVGPGQRDTFLLPSVVAQALRSNEIVVGNLDVGRDLTDVRDVVRAYRLLATTNGVTGIYNVCSGKSITVREVVQAVMDAANSSATVRVDPSRVRTGEPAEIRGSYERLQRETGWRPLIPIATTVADTIAFMGARPV